MHYLILSFLILLLIPTFIALVFGAPWVPTPKKVVIKMLNAAHIKPKDIIYDLGCGDGRIVHLAVKNYQAIGVGLELSPVIYLMAKIKSFLFRSRAKILFRDFRYYSLKNADVIFCYLMPKTNQNLEKKLAQELKKGARVISYAFQFKNWKESNLIPKNPQENHAPIWVYEMGKI